MSFFEDFALFPGAFLKGSHPSLNLKDLLDVYSPQVYELVGGGRLPEQRAKGPNEYGAAGGLAPQFIPGKVAEQTLAILARGDLADELKEYLEVAKTKMPGKLKQAVQNMLINAARRSRFKCAVMLVDEYDADVNAVSISNQQSALHFAAYNGDVQLAKELLSRGASKTLTNSYKETPAATAHQQAENFAGDDLKCERYEECCDLIENFTLTPESAAPNNRSGLESISTYVPTSQSGEVVDTYLALNRASMGIFNKVTDDNEAQMFARLRDLVPGTGFNRAERERRGEKFELRHFMLVVENLWKTAIAQPVMAGLYASLADKLHSHFVRKEFSESITAAQPTSSGKFYRTVFDEKLLTPLFDSERAALAEAAKCVNFKRELLSQCYQQFKSERDLARFRREVDWASLTDELAVMRAENDVMYARNKAQDRMTANVVFIGQLFNHGLATTSIIRSVVEDLLPETRITPAEVVEASKTDKDALPDYISGLENDLTMLVKLLEVIGQKFERGANPLAGPNASADKVAEYEKAKKGADRRRKLLAKWFKAMKKVTESTKLGVENEFKLQNRVRFLVQDLVELRNRGWVTRGLADAKGGAKKATTDDDGWTSVPGSGGAGGGGAAGPGSPTSGGGGGGNNIVTANPTAAPSSSHKVSKTQRKADKARAAADARAAEEAARRTEVNKEAQALADELYVFWWWWWWCGRCCCLLLVVLVFVVVVVVVVCCLVVVVVVAAVGVVVSRDVHPLHVASKRGACIRSRSFL